MSTLYENIAGWMWQYKSLSVKPTTYDRLETSLRMLAKYRHFIHQSNTNNI